MPAALRVVARAPARASDHPASQQAAAAARAHPTASATKPSARNDTRAPERESSTHAHVRHPRSRAGRRAITTSADRATRHVSALAPAASPSNQKSIPASSCPMRAPRRIGCRRARGPPGDWAMTATWPATASAAAPEETNPTVFDTASARASSPSAPARASLRRPTTRCQTKPASGGATIVHRVRERARR